MEWRGKVEFELRVLDADGNLTTANVPVCRSGAVTVSTPKPLATMAATAFAGHPRDAKEAVPVKCFI